MIYQFSISTRGRTEFLDITSKIAEIVDKNGDMASLCMIFIPHTTAAITINENADPDVMLDIAGAIDTLIPWSDKSYRHMEGNSAAHLKSSIIGCSETVIVEKSQLLLGTWQGIYFCEFDGPRKRRVQVKIV